MESYESPQDRNENCLLWTVLTRTFLTNVAWASIGYPAQSTDFISESVSEHLPKNHPSVGQA